ncbi:MAG TPA: hypothetical protein DD638_01665, partial [Pasteurellaceae bacterium]|nr:hypothetical protein [Pasteurellaceae bacterium]
QHNLDVESAKSRLQEAQANSQYADADLGPSISAMGVTGALRSQTDRLFTTERATSTANMRLGSVTASWEIDFFGKKQSDADAAQSMVLSAREQIFAAQMLVASQIAENYFNIFALQQQHSILKQYENTLQQLKHYIQGRFRAGQANANDILEVEHRISTIQARQATLDNQMATHQRSIAVLIGKTPQGFNIAKTVTNPLNRLPAEPKGTIPSDLLSRRPDLRSSQYYIQAQAAKLASAKADLYPRFDIQFIGQTGRINLDTNIPDLKGWAGLVSAGINVPIFTNGRIQANIDAADARLKNALLQYDKALLQALADVDNSYQAQYALNNQMQLIQTADQQAKSQASNAEKLFRYGEKTLDNVLTAKLIALDYQEQLIQIKLNRAKNLVSLYKALGGGWSDKH